jgi:tetratricopeptide (TPR) repeat protein
VTDENNNETSLFAELRRRKLVRSMIAYLVAAWLLVQVAATVLPIFDAPKWALRAFVTLVVLGFTPAMIFAWLFNITPQGLEATAQGSRQPGALRSLWFRGLVGGITLLLSGAAIWWVWTDYLAESAAGFDAAGRPPANPVVAVTEIRNLSGNVELDWMSEGLANLVRTNLAQSRHAVVVSQQRWDAITREHPSTDAAYEAAEAAGIEYVFAGEFISAPAGLYLAARLTNIKTGVERGAESFDALTPETMLGTGYRLSMLARRGLQIPHTESVDSFAADFVVNNMTAYEAYVGGLEYFRRFDYAQAEQSFAAALELAPAFHIARYRLAHVYMSSGRQSEAVETILAVPDDAPLPQRDRLYIDAAKAFFQFDLASAIAVYRELLELYPYEVEARQFLAEVYFHKYDENTAVEELKLLALQEPENEFIWGSMGTYLILSGRLDEAQEPLETYLRLAAEKAHPLTMLGDLARQRGEYQAASDYYAQALEVDANFSEARRGQAQVLALLGDTAAAKAIWSGMIADPAIAADERIFAAFDYAWVLRAEGRFRESLQPLLTLETEIREERIREPLALATRALSHMELGESDIALQLAMQALASNQASSPARYLFTRGLIEVQQQAFEAVTGTIGELRKLSPTEGDADRKEERAAAHLEGLLLLAQGKAPEAVSQLEAALAIPGYDYAILELGLARALQAVGQLDRSLEHAVKAANYHDPAEVRLDLQRDRVRALLLQSQLQDQLGNGAQARQLAERFLQQWQQADLPHRDIELARDLAGR